MSKDKLNDVAGAEAEALVWDAIAEMLRKAVLYALPRYAGHTPGGSVSQKDAWRQAKPEALAEQIVTFAMAGIHPVLTNAQVANGVKMMRATLERAGIDPAELPWHEAVQEVQKS